MSEVAAAMGSEAAIRRLAERHGIAADAVRHLGEAIRAGGGAMAQFDHPALGGMGQWSRGGMLMIGRMNDHGLKARVAALADDLAGAVAEGLGTPAAATTEETPQPSDRGGGRWWPASLGQPAASGAQNDHLYAVFPDKRRLAIGREGRVSVFDTADHRIGGAAQAQGTGSDDLFFSSQHGRVFLRDLAEVSEN